MPGHLVLHSHLSCTVLHSCHSQSNHPADATVASARLETVLGFQRDISKPFKAQHSLKLCSCCTTASCDTMHTDGH
jgi:hypothetical protein